MGKNPGKMHRRRSVRAPLHWCSIGCCISVHSVFFFHNWSVNYRFSRVFFIRFTSFEDSDFHHMQGKCSHRPKNDFVCCTT